MASKRFLVSVLAALLLICFTSWAWASSVWWRIDYIDPDPSAHLIDGVWHSEQIEYVTQSGDLDYSPDSPKSFNVEGSASFEVTHYAWTNGGPPGPASIEINESETYLLPTCGVCQAGPLRFTDVLASVTFHYPDGNEHTEQFEYVASQWDLDPIYPPYITDFGGALGMVPGPITIPISYTPWGDGYNWWGWGDLTLPVEVTVSLSGNVIPAVPIPPALLLLGSGLAGLAIYRRRKVIG